MKCKQCATEFDGKFCPECGAGTKKKKKPFFLRWWFILLLLIGIIVVVLTLGGGGEKIIWDDLVLGDVIPEPPVKKGEIHTNTTDSLWVEISGFSDKQYADYISVCKEKGFVVDAVSESYSYEAYNAEGYKLSLGHYGSDADMSIRVEACMEMTAITWPAGSAGRQLPEPKSAIGKFSYEYDDDFYVYVGNTSKAEYAEYVNACSEKGFIVNYGKGDDYYYAINNEGWQVSVCYEGNNIMSISITKSTETDSSNDEQESDAENEVEQESTDNEGLDPDFKSAMDSYESFIDEYIDFMKKYNDNPSDLELLTAYAEYMNDYVEFVEKFEKWEEEDLNAAEAEYYLEVQTRVSQKLLEAAL